MKPPTPSWHPFQTCPAGERAPAPREVDSAAGIGDRLRAAAFAEIQARDAFLWAADTFADSPADLRGAWRALARAEQKHLDWLLIRMKELGIDPAERPVSDQLWHSFVECETAEKFARYMASAEERGRRAGIRFREAMAKVDPVSAEIFGKIADEELEHIQLAERFFPRAES
ncbi:MAG: DUF455 family protein [Bacteriovoracia bacterium]